MQSPPQSHRARRPLLPRAARAGGLALLLALSSCASLSFEQTTKTSGTFRSTGFAWTILSIDLPKTAEQIARENAADSRMVNMQVTEVVVRPYLGAFDWLLDIIGCRYARVSGTWGFPGR